MHGIPSIDTFDTEVLIDFGNLRKEDKRMETIRMKVSLTLGIIEF